MEKLHKSCPLSFISFHKKGNGSSDGVTDASLNIIQKIRKLFPNLSNIFYVNE